MSLQKEITTFRNDARKIWGKINEEMGNKKKSNSFGPMKVNGQSTTKADLIANAFNKHYTSVATKLDEDLPRSNVDPLSFLRGNFPDSMVVPYVTPHDTSIIISSLKNKKSDINNIPVTLIKLVSQSLSTPLSNLFNQSLQNGIFPDCLKHANVIPLYKKGPKAEISNYRPISLLSIFSKILEKQMKIHLVKYLEQKSILSSHQFGFRNGLSTFDALNSLSKDLFNALDNRMSAITVYIDFKSAFDTINHAILLRKMEFYGIRGTVLDWFKSYLTDRTQSVTYQNNTSGRLYQTKGIPQGSVLGPVLFLIYIQDMAYIFNSLKCLLFADDSSLNIVGPNLLELIYRTNAELDKLYTWVLSNRLTINTSKTHYMITTNKSFNFLPPLFINFEIIKCVSHHKVLGVILDNKLKFHEHIKSISHKINSSIAMLNHIKNLVPNELKRCLYFSHIQSHLTYCMNIYGFTYPTHLMHLFKLQKKALRVITNSDYQAHSNPLFKNLNILKHFDLVKLEAGTYAYKNKNSNEFLQLTHDYNTRFRADIVLPAHNLSIYQNSLSYNSIKIWNSIERNIKIKSTVKSFRSNYRKFLMSSY